VQLKQCFNHDLQCHDCNHQLDQTGDHDPLLADCSKNIHEIHVTIVLEQLVIIRPRQGKKVKGKGG
jgi:hypothetical protein